MKIHISDGEFLKRESPKKDFGNIPEIITFWEVLFSQEIMGIPKIPKDKKTEVAE